MNLANQFTQLWHDPSRSCVARTLVRKLDPQATCTRGYGWIQYNFTDGSTIRSNGRGWKPSGRIPMTSQDLTNLLEETIAMLEKYRHCPNDVLWVGTKDWSCTFADFAERAKSIDYDSGYGLARVRVDLVIVGWGWWLERAEYDGSEWWVHKIPPTHQGPIGPCGTILDAQTRETGV
jgi:hypothetical protein